MVQHHTGVGIAGGDQLTRCIILIAVTLNQGPLAGLLFDAVFAQQTPQDIAMEAGADGLLTQSLVCNSVSQQLSSNLLKNNIYKTQTLA